jgi:flavin-dependent thymidylate synthase
MIVKLAGFNVDIENIRILNDIISRYPDITEDDIKKIKKLHWTPETISASYARISRDPRPIEELREIARNEIEKSRKSNTSIIFDMGHSSIAEHGVFNIDIIGISRLLAETLQKSRLASFTEKSQRYIKIGEDILLPEEFKKNKDLFNQYKELTKILFETYNKLHDNILPYFLDQNPGITKNDKGYRDIINLAKEDARYILPLATLTQVGMTINARSLEKMIKRLNSSPLIEANLLGEKLFKIIEGYAPSLVKYTKPDEYNTDTYKDINNFTGDISVEKNNKEVVLIKIDNDIEELILSAFIVKTTGIDLASAIDLVKSYDKNKKETLFKQSVKHLKSYDSVLREYELGDVIFNLTVSSSCYAQLKRHRIATIIDGNYSTKLDVTIPESIIKTGNKNLFMENILRINDLYDKIKNNYGLSSDYILSNAHRKNVILKCNFRELVHITRLRSDKHAQWDIRNISDKMIEEVKAKMPLFSKLLGGKHDFERIKNQII